MGTRPISPSSIESMAKRSGSFFFILTVSMIQNSVGVKHMVSKKIICILCYSIRFTELLIKGVFWYSVRYE